MIQSEAIRPEILENYQIFDIRSPREWEETGIIEGSILLPLTLENGDIDPNFLVKFQSNVAKFDKINHANFEKNTKSKEIAIVCATGQRSSWAANFIKSRLGVEVINLKGGFYALLMQNFVPKPYKAK